jgi:diguanylate cyclase (GGDEF)-like protein
VSRRQRAGLAGGTIAVGVAAAADRRALVVLAALALVVSALRVLWTRPALARGWWRGWGLVAAAAVPSAVSLAAPPGSIVRPVSMLLSGALVLGGLLGALPGREPARARELALEAALGGGLVTYLVGAFVPGTSVLQLASLAVVVSAWWALVLFVLRERDHATAATRWLAAAFAGVLAAHVLDAVLPGSSLAGSLPRAIAGMAVVVWTVACCQPEYDPRAPAALPPTELLHAGHVRVVIGGVLAGPFAVTVHWALLPEDHHDLVTLAVAGGALALVSVLHLLQLVRDHGHRAWEARHDALTGLPSEPLFEDRLERAMARGRRTGTGFTVAFLDLDGFKRVNDRDGHAAGDRALRTVAGRLRDAVREQDTVARRSGDEFLVLLEGLEDPAAAEQVAAKLLGALRPPIGPRERSHRLGASVGLARWPEDGGDPDELMRHADAAMYEAKERGSGTVRWYTSAVTARLRLRLALARQLEASAASGDQLELAFHPRVDLRDGRVVELVTLVRWRHPELGLLLPDSFLPLAADAGLAKVLDLAILELACRKVHGWTEAGLVDLPVLVHLADGTLGDATMEEDVVEVLRRTGLQPRQLGLAVTEAALTAGGARAARSIDDLAELGVRTTVVRFGTGAVGLRTLSTVPLGGIELDESLLTALTDRPVPPVIAAVLAFADRLGLTATASGVGSAEQAERLRAAGCGTARGPHLAPPVLASTLGLRLRRLAGHGADRKPLLAADLSGSALPGIEQPEVAALLAATASPDAEVDGRVLAELLARVEGATPA